MLCTMYIWKEHLNSRMKIISTLWWAWVTWRQNTSLNVNIWKNANKWNKYYFFIFTTNFSFIIAYDRKDKNKWRIYILLIDFCIQFSSRWFHWFIFSKIWPNFIIFCLTMGITPVHCILKLILFFTEIRPLQFQI